MSGQNERGGRGSGNTARGNRGQQGNNAWTSGGNRGQHDGGAWSRGGNRGQQSSRGGYRGQQEGGDWGRGGNRGQQEGGDWGRGGNRGQQEGGDWGRGGNRGQQEGGDWGRGGNRGQQEGSARDRGSNRGQQEGGARDRGSNRGQQEGGAWGRGGDQRGTAFQYSTTGGGQQGGHGGSGQAQRDCGEWMSANTGQRGGMHRDDRRDRQGGDYEGGSRGTREGGDYGGGSRSQRGGGDFRGGYRGPRGGGDYEGGYRGPRGGGDYGGGSRGPRGGGDFRGGYRGQRGGGDFRGDYRGQRGAGGQRFQRGDRRGREVWAANMPGLFKSANPDRQDVYTVTTMDSLKSLASLDHRGIKSATSEVTIGRAIKFDVNFFQLLHPTNFVVHTYDVKIARISKNDQKSDENINISKMLKARIVGEALNDMVNKHKTGNELKYRIVYDGESLLYIMGDVKDIDCTLFEYTHRQAFHVSFTEVTEVDMSMKKLSVTDNRSSPLQTSELRSKLAVIDTVIKFALTRRIESYGRSFFDLKCRAALSLTETIGLYSGLFACSNVSFKSLTLNVDTAFAVFRPEMMLSELLRAFGFREDDFNAHTVRDNIVANMDEKMMDNRKLLVYYDREKKQKRYFRFHHFERKTAYELKFNKNKDDAASEQISVADYFRLAYNHTCDRDRMLVATGKTGEAFLPFELVWLEAKKVSRDDSERFAADIIRHTAKSPMDRKLAILDRTSMLRDNGDECSMYLRTWHIECSNRMNTVDGRVLNPPTLFGESVVINDVGFKGFWNCPPKFRYFSPPTKSPIKWSYVVLPNARVQMHEVDNFFEMLTRRANQFGIMMEQKGYFHDWSHDNIQKEIIKYTLSSAPFDITFFVSNGIGVEYQVVKSLCELSTIGSGVISQFLMDRTITKRNPGQIVENICHKLCVKLGGVNVSLINTRNNRIFDPMTGRFHSTMFVGLDVTHSIFRQNGCISRVSIAAVVASMDQIPYTYSTRICLQKNPKESRASMEIVYNMLEIMSELFTQYRNRNKCLPERVIVYRDGVSDGQFEQVKSFELNALFEAYRALSPDKSLPKVSLIVVQKRHHLRMFPPEKDARNQLKNGNVLPGTLFIQKDSMDTLIDAYLCSHAGIQGTSRPSRYRLVFDSIGLSADQLLTMTYNLCHLYAKCFRSVSIPAPCYYAHHVAFRARYYVDFLRECDPHIKDYLFKDALCENKKQISTQKSKKTTPQEHVSMADKEMKFLIVKVNEEISRKMFFC